MKLCRTCRYGSEYELDKPCIVYREDCPLYEKEGDAMNREKAIEELKGIKSAYSNKQQFHEARLMQSEHEALNMAIKALEDIPKYKDAYNKGWDDGAKAAYEHLKMCEEEQESCDDAISRQAVLDVLEKEGHKWGNDYRDWVDAIEEIKKLPPVNLQGPKTEPKYCDHNICVSNEYNGISCDECEVTKSQEPNCPYYVIDDDGHGLCKNHRYVEDVLGKIRAEIEKPMHDERCFDTADAKAQYIALNWCIEIIDKYKAESDHKCHTCKHYMSGEYDGSCDSNICEHYSGWESEDEG